MENQYNFQPFISKKGYIGMAPEFSIPGNIICVFLWGHSSIFTEEGAGKGA
jgi:hypothetical protein